MSEDALTRIEQFMEQDLVRLLDAIEEADEALLELEAGKRKRKMTATPAPARRRHGTGQPAPSRYGTPSPAPSRQPRAANPRPLRAKWEEVRGRLVSHIERERTLVLPTCKHVVEGMDSLRGGLKAPVRQMVAEHRELSEGVLAVRLEAARVEPVRREFLTMCRLWDEHVQTEESLVFPEALSEITDEVSLIHDQLDVAQDADHIGANLRLAAARSHAAEPTEEVPKKGVVGRFLGLFDRKR